MTVDPSDPDTFEDVQPEEPGDEAQEADAAEEHAGIGEERDEPLTDVDRNAANEADAAEQARVVAQDDDDYR